MPFEGAQFTSTFSETHGFVTGSSGALSQNADAFISVSRSATGTYAITVNNWKPSLPETTQNVTAATNDRTVNVVSRSKSGTTLTINVKARTSDPTAASAADADSDFYFQVVGAFNTDH